MHFPTYSSIYHLFPHDCALDAVENDLHDRISCSNCIRGIYAPPEDVSDVLPNLDLMAVVDAQRLHAAQILLRSNHICRLLQADSYFHEMRDRSAKEAAQNTTSCVVSRGDCFDDVPPHSYS